MASLNPFRGLGNPLGVWAWGMYDLANQSFQLVVNTLLFGVYLQQVVADSPERGKTFWAGLVSVSLIIVVVLSPFVGAIVDARRCKRLLLLITGLISAALTAALALVGKGDLALAAAIYIPAAIMVGLGENVLAGFLPQLATSKNMGYVSAVGWTMSYIGAIFLQLIVLVGVMVFKWDQAAEWRPLFIFAGVWFAAGILPAAFLLRDSTTPAGPARDLAAGTPSGAGGIVVQATQRLRDTIRQTGRFRQLVRFLSAFFVYSLGVQTIVYFAGTIGTDFGFTTQDLFLLTLVLSVMAGAASMLLAKFQDRIGTRRSLGIVLAVWIVTALGIALMYRYHAPKSLLWVFSLGIGFGLGGVGSASRAMVGSFTPADKGAEFFGLWGMVYKSSGVVGPMVFAYAWVGLGAPAALLILTAFFVVGILMLWRVDEAAGIAAAGGPEASSLSMRGASRPV